MRYRELDEDGDYTFGRGPGQFLIDSPEAVGQLVKTRLRLARGEWFLDTTDGTPWDTEILGRRTAQSYDPAIRARVRDTQGVRAITEYSSELDQATRVLSVRLTIDTIYGELDDAITDSVRT